MGALTRDGAAPTYRFEAGPVCPSTERPLGSSVVVAGPPTFPLLKPRTAPAGLVALAANPALVRE
jgi:hypothetical protein